MMLQLTQVEFAYSESDRPALRDCNLKLDTTAITVRVGSNGAGKSTLIRLLTGQLYGYSGRYLLDGREADVLHGEWLATNRFGYAPDIPVLDPLMTGLEMLLMVGAFRGMDEDAVLREIQEYGAVFELGDPAYTFLDEPFDGLDPIAIYTLKRHLKERKARGLGALLSSHMLDASEKVADDILIMKEGRVAFAGPIRKLLENRPEGTELEEIYFEYFQK
ncbi:MAG TPA: ATP-binding cassette domain-containing protein [Fibrobacteria bacterium]|nr:ATP-binding cassette domain-containing protein [Fibrobacteria bacterium]